MRVFLLLVAVAPTSGRPARDRTDIQSVHFLRSEDRNPLFKELFDMSQQVDMVKAAFAAFGRGDVPGILNCLTDDVDWQPVYGAGKHVPQAGQRHGKPATADFFRILGESTQFNTFEPHEFVETGNTVIALGSYKATVRATGRTVASDWAMVFGFRDGRIASFKEFTDSAALNAAYVPVAVSA